MRISLNGAGKRYGRQPVSAPLTANFEGPGRYAVLGPNGSGKSTLLRLLGGMQTPSTGKISWEHAGAVVASEKLHGLVGYCAPGMELVEELTLQEAVRFHFSFKAYLRGFSAREVIKHCGLQRAADKPLSEFSSGMRQRVKLALAFFCDAPLLLLDEPCTNLDDAGVEQYREWVEGFGSGRLIIVASNDPREYSFCEHQLQLVPA